MPLSVLFYLVVILWTALLIFVSSFCIKSLAFPIEKRYLHFRLVIISFVLAVLFSNEIIATILIPLLGDFINSPSVYGILSDIIPKRMFEIVFMLICLLLLNSIYVFVHIIVLFIARRFIYRNRENYVDYDQCDGIERVFRFPWKIVNRYYDQDNGRPQLKKLGYSLGVSVKYMKWISVSIWVAEILIMMLVVAFNLFAISGLILDVSKYFYLLPLTLFFIFGQIQLFLEGPETEKQGDIDSVDISKKMLGNVEALVPCYIEAFSNSDAIITVEKGQHKSISGPDYHGNSVGNNQLIDCKEPGISEIIFGQMKMSGIEMNFEYQNAIISLLNHESVFIRDNIEGEFTSYYCTYISYFVSQGKCALVICSDDLVARNMFAEMKRAYSSVRGMNALCNIAFVNELDSVDNPNVIICTYSDIINIDFALRYKHLAEKICFAVFPKCECLFALTRISLEIILSKIKALPNRINFAFISNENNNRIRDELFSLFFYDNIGLETFNNDIRHAKTCVMVWRGESFCNLPKELKLGNEGVAYLGTALSLAYVAIKENFPKVYIIEGKRSGDKFFLKNASESNTLESDLYFDTRIDLKSSIVMRSSEATAEEDLKVICIYDDNYNFFDAARMWFKYAGSSGTLIHVISPSYMLREFFADNYKRLMLNSSAYSALISDKLCIDTTRKLSILAMFADNDVEERVLELLMLRYEWSYPSVSEMLLDAVKIIRPEAHSFYDYFLYLDDTHYQNVINKVVNNRKVRMINKKLIDELVESVRPAIIQIGENNYSSSNVLNGNILNYYLPKQLVSFDGRYYQIDKIDPDGAIHTNTITPDKTFDYYVISDFEISNAVCIDNGNDHHNLDFNIYEAEVTRNFFGYISSVKGNDFSNASKYLDFASFTRSVSRKNIPVLEIRIGKDLFEDGIIDHKVVKLLSVLFNGVFMTLYPNLHQNLIAVPNSSLDRESCKKISQEMKTYTAEELINLYIGGVYESSIIHDDQNESASLYIIEFSCVEYGLVNSLYQNITPVLEMIYRYLNWYLNSGKGCYLHFGLEEIPNVFDANKLKNILQVALNNHEEPMMNESCMDSFDEATFNIYTCSFCGCESKFAWKLGDGRIMCGHCHNQMKSQADEIKVIFNHIKYSMERLYDIDIDKSIDICFQSKDAIERIAGKSSTGRTVGFYYENNEKKQLWIERMGPSVAMQSTMAHELTHAWQYAAFDMRKLEKALGKNSKKKKLILLEGHAVFVQIETMRLLGEVHFSQRLYDEFILRNDEYGVGYRFFKSYFDMKNTDGEGYYSPFKVMELLVQEIMDGGDIKWPAELKEL